MLYFGLLWGYGVFRFLNRKIDVETLLQSGSVLPTGLVDCADQFESTVEQETSYVLYIIIPFSNFSFVVYFYAK